MARTDIGGYRYAMEMTTPNDRFREARERLGLSLGEVSERSGVSLACLWDIETMPDELASVYSPMEIQQLCEVIHIRPIDLFADEFSEPPISAPELVELIKKECQSRHLNFEQFEDLIGWEFSSCLNTPENLLKGFSVDGLQDLCRELRVDWRRMLLAPGKNEG